MQAVILAGGLATRLRPLSLEIPKALIQVGGKPFIAHLLDLLKANGIIDVVLCIGNLGNRVRARLGDGSEIGMRLRYSQETDQLLGTGGALKLAQALLDERFLIINGDTYIPIDCRQLENYFLGTGKKGLMVVYENKEDNGVSSNVKLSEDSSIVVNYDKKGEDSDLEYVDAGILALHREVLNLIESGHPVSLGDGIIRPLIEQRELGAYITRERFFDMGTFEGLKIFEAFLKGRR